MATIAKKYLLIRLLGVVGIELIAMVIMSDLPSEIVGAVVTSFFGAAFAEIIFFVIWWLYFKKSKRVQNTYG